MCVCQCVCVNVFVCLFVCLFNGDKMQVRDSYLVDIGGVRHAGMQESNVNKRLTVL